MRSLAALCLLATVGLAGCAQRPQDVAVSHGKEYFPSSVYGPASKRVIADGQPVPRGGGQYLVGKPYTVAGRTYYPSENKSTQVGYASWYGDAFHGRLTANGEIYDRDAFTAASPTMPIPSYARVTNLRNNYSMIVRVNDRGPYASNRIMDVSKRVAEALDYKRYGTTLLKVEYVGRASLAGSDDARLYATLRTDSPATRANERTMLARAASRSRFASTSSVGNQDTEPQPRRVDRRANVRVASLQAEPAEEGGARTRRTREARDEPAYGTRHDETVRAPFQGDRNTMRRRHVASGYGEDVDQGRERHSGRDVILPGRTHEADGMSRVSSSRADRSTERRREAIMPPSRPMDLGTIPGAASQIHAHRDAPRLRLARSRDD